MSRKDICVGNHMVEASVQEARKLLKASDDDLLDLKNAASELSKTQTRTRRSNELSKRFSMIDLRRKHSSVDRTRMLKKN
jgi:hypothetical protein